MMTSLFPHSLPAKLSRKNPQEVFRSYIPISWRRGDPAASSCQLTQRRLRCASPWHGPLEPTNTWKKNNVVVVEWGHICTCHFNKKNRDGFSGKDQTIRVRGPKGNKNMPRGSASLLSNFQEQRSTLFTDQGCKLSENYPGISKLAIALVTNASKEIPQLGLSHPLYIWSCYTQTIGAILMANKHWSYLGPVFHQPQSLWWFILKPPSFQANFFMIHFTISGFSPCSPCPTWPHHGNHGLSRIPRRWCPGCWPARSSHGRSRERSL